MSWLEQNCPRLAAARNAHVEAVQASAMRRRSLESRLVRLERLLAHRELQLRKEMRA